ncbi:hypothetical protein GBAR_LOCUS31480 [Geodia barretti]|uniref:Uncharacterized protein n=1 Tax=Geodia barretti TaxID=519541 RepID=A0AA35U283_GEOBA|nr:hypothetical protein GBAR_LOCUS31480 [Geodia barretti]
MTPQKERLTQLRRERELEEFENENKGGYVSVYPTSDPSRARLYSRLLHDALSFNSLGRNYSAQSNRSGSSVGGCGLSGKGRGSRCGLQYMEEPELLEILSQCEDEDSPLLPTRLLVRRPSTSCVQPLALEDSSPLGDMFQVMAARLHEEEQTQRTMVSLREMAPFYPGKSQTEVQAVLERVSCWSCDPHMISHVIPHFRFGRISQATRQRFARFGLAVLTTARENSCWLP